MEHERKLRRQQKDIKLICKYYKYRTRFIWAILLCSFTGFGLISGAYSALKFTNATDDEWQSKIYMGLSIFGIGLDVIAIIVFIWWVVFSLVGRQSFRRLGFAMLAENILKNSAEDEMIYS